MSLMIVPVVILVLLCTANAAAMALAAQGRGISEGMGAVTGTAARQLSEDDPCGGFCETLGRNCIVERNGQAFCADCAGLLKPTSSDTGSFVECCKYNAEKGKCVSALRASSVGICLRSEDLFVRASDPTPASVRSETGNACGKILDFLDNGLACRMRTGRSGVLKCINFYGTVQAPCSSSYVQVGADIDGDDGSNISGSAVAMSVDGRRVAIGAPYHDSFSGQVRVFELRESEGWVQVGQDIDGESRFDQSGLAVAMSADGNRVAVGAPFNDGNALSAGHARVFELQGSERWVQVGQDIDGESKDDVSGAAVVMSADGSRVAIGAPTRRIAGTNRKRGSVRVFDMLGSEGWVQVGQVIVGESRRDFSGGAVAMSADGSRLAIGAGKNEGKNGSNSGHVRVFEMLGSEGWVQVGQDIDGESEFDRSGESVAMSADGSRVAIGAYKNDGNGRNSGHVRVFEMLGSEGWVQVGQDIDGEAIEDESGFSVAMSADGGRLAIGAKVNDGNGNGSGHARVFAIQGSEGWVQVGQDIDGESLGDLSGTVAMSADGSRLAIGALGNNGNGLSSGHVRVFDEVRQCP